MVNANKYDFFLALFVADNRFSIDDLLSGGMFFAVWMDMKGYLFVTAIAIDLFTADWGTNLFALGNI